MFRSQLPTFSDPPKLCSGNLFGTTTTPSFGCPPGIHSFTTSNQPFGFKFSPPSATAGTLFGTTSTPTTSTTMTINPGVGASSAPAGGTSAITITSGVGTAGNSITIAPSVGPSVTISPAPGTSITITQAAGTITITSNPTSGATSTPVIDGARASSFSFAPPTSTPTSTPGFCTTSFSFPTPTAPAFAQSTSTTSSSPVGASSPFGPQRTPFGGTRGSRVAPYTSSELLEPYGNAAIESISAMPIHQDKSREQLRWEDYQLGDKGGAAYAGWSGFSQEKQTERGVPYGSPFAQTSSSTFKGFNMTDSSPFGQTSSSLFRQPSSSPFAQQSPSPFGHSSASPFGQPSSSPFAQPSPRPFCHSSSSPFGHSSTCPFGHSSPCPFGPCFGNPTHLPSSLFGKSSSPHSSMPSQVSQTGISAFSSIQTNTGNIPRFGCSVGNTGRFGLSPNNCGQFSPFS